MVYITQKNIKIKRLSDKLDFIKIRLFRIKEKLGEVVFKINLFK